MLDIRKACLEPQKWNLLEIKQIKKAQYKDKFMEYQKEQRFKTVEKLGCLENEIKVKLEKSCEESL